MISYTLLSAHVSSILPSQIDTQVLNTKQRDLQLPDPNEPAELLSDHASFACYYNSPEQPPILLRLIQNRYTIQLSSINSQFPPRLFRFPSPIISTPFIIPDQYTEAHVIAITASGSIYRIVLPVTKKSPLHDAVCSEQVLKAVPPTSLSLVHVSDPGLVFVGLKDGTILKLQARRAAGTRFSDWSESFMKLPMSLFNALPLPGRSTGRSDIVGFASAPVPAQTEVVFTLSRDRQLRVWREYCIGETLVPASFDPSTGPTAPAKNTPLLPPIPRSYIRVLPPLESEDTELEDDDANRRIMVFMPTPTNSSAGFFVTYRLSPRRGNGTRELERVSAKSCSPASVGTELRDFVVVDNTIWVLWESHGQAALEYSTLESVDGDSDDDDEDPSSWRYVAPPNEPDLSPSHFDTLLSQDGCLPEIFLSALLRPGAFSRVTLKSALGQYVDALSSVSSLQTSALNISYPSLSENIVGVVGCSVDLAIDTQTGEQLWDQYWSALKRDWEGFVARCKEVERSARWPLGLGVTADGTRMVVLERERLATVVVDDVLVKSYKSTLNPGGAPSTSPHVAVFTAAWRFQQTLPPATRIALETGLTDVTRETIAFSLPDVAADLAKRLLLPGLDTVPQREIQNWLYSSHNIGVAFQGALDLLTSLDDEVKLEEQDPDDALLQYPIGGARANGSTPLLQSRGSSSLNSEWSKAFTAAFVTTTVNARYELSLALLILLLYVVDTLPDKLIDESAVFEDAFASFRSLSILRFFTNQAGGDPEAARGDLSQADDVLAKLDNIRLSSVGAGEQERKPLPYSLVHNFLGEDSTPLKTHESAQKFLRTNALLRAHDHISPLLPEVNFVDRLREQGYLEIAKEVASWLPKAPGVTYELARIYLDSGRADEASHLFHAVANSFDTHGLLPDVSSQALSSVLPFQVEHQNLSNFYRHVTALFDRLLYDQHVITFARLAMEAAPQVPDPQVMEELANKVFRAYVALGLYEDAYMMIVEYRDTELQQAFIRHLVEAMCDHAEIDRLTRLSFVGFQTEVERTLSFKARNADPLAWPDYSKVLYAWHVFRGDYRSAGGTMYQQAKRLSEVPIRPNQFLDVALLQAQCYLAAINALSLVDPKNAWVAVATKDDPASPNPDDDQDAFQGTSRKVKKLLCNNVPLDQLGEDHKDNVEVVDLAAMKHEYILVLSRIELARRYPDHAVANFTVSAEDVVSSYIQDGAFDDAISAARSLDVDMSPLFENLTNLCIQLSRSGQDQLEEYVPWLTSDRVRSWQGTPSQRAWRYLQESLERNDRPENDWTYRKTVLKTILDADHTWRLPRWLVQSFETNQPEFLIRMCLKYDLIEDALRYSIQLLKSANTAKGRENPIPMSSWVPYTVIDQVLAVAQLERDGDAVKESVKLLTAELRRELEARLAQTKRMTQESRRR